jgi:hypothetical protein
VFVKGVRPDGAVTTVGPISVGQEDTITDIEGRIHVSCGGGGGGGGGVFIVLVVVVVLVLLLVTAAAAAVWVWWLSL